MSTTSNSNGLRCSAVIPCVVNTVTLGLFFLWYSAGQNNEMVAPPPAGSVADPPLLLTVFPDEKPSICRSCLWPRAGNKGHIAVSHLFPERVCSCFVLLSPRSCGRSMGSLQQREVKFHARIVTSDQRQAGRRASRRRAQIQPRLYL